MKGASFFCGGEKLGKWIAWEVTGIKSKPLVAPV
jgi:hypothetical protein